MHNLAHDTPIGPVVAQIWRPPQDDPDALTLVWSHELNLRFRNQSFVVRLPQGCFDLISTNNVITHINCVDEWFCIDGLHNNKNLIPNTSRGHL